MKYRFKTKGEFEEEFGSKWRDIVGNTWVSPDMDYLFGQYIKDEDNKEFNDVYNRNKSYYRSYDRCWNISRDMIKLISPSYKPKKIDRTIENMSFIYEKVLYAFDLDDTLVYSERFEEHVKPLLNEFLTPEIILKNKIDEIGIDLSKLKYENGRIFFYDPNNLVDISKNSTWVRKKERVYITQPEAYYLTSESMPIGTYDKIVDLYNKAKYKAIITARKERLRNQTIEALNNLNIEMPNYGLFMYPDDSIIFSSKWKANKLIDLYENNNFTQIHYFDDNMKLLKRIQSSTKSYKDKILLYKVTENTFRKI